MPVHERLHHILDGERTALVAVAVDEAPLRGVGRVGQLWNLDHGGQVGGGGGGGGNGFRLMLPRRTGLDKFLGIAAGSGCSVAVGLALSKGKYI